MGLFLFVVILFCFCAALCVEVWWGQEWGLQYRRQPDETWGKLLEACFFSSPTLARTHRAYPHWTASDLCSSVLRSKIQTLGLQGAEKTGGYPNLG